METFSFVEMWKNMGPPAKGVVIILAIMSVYSLAVMGERLVTFMRARSRSLRFVVSLGRLLKSRDVKGANALAHQQPQPPIARVVASALDEYAEGVEALRSVGPDDVGDFDLVDAVNRAIERTKEREIADLRRGLGGLATIASAAPFVGLFGTVVGIINAFRSMAQSGQGGLGAVSAGISEALVTTAFGLLVAIPAVMVYNYFTNRVDDFIVDMDDVSSELISFVLKEGAHSDPILVRYLSRGYKALLRQCLRHPAPVYAVAAAGLVAVVVAYGAIGKTFMPTMDEGAVIVQITKNPSINLQASIEGDLLIQRLLKKKVPEIERVVARVGSDELGLDPMGLNETDTFMVLKPKDQWRKPDKEWLIEQFRLAMSDLPGYEFAFTQPIEMRTAEMLTGARGDLAIKIFGPDLAALSDLAGKIQATLSKVSGASEVSTVANDSVDYLQIEIDRLAAGRTGLSVARLEDELRAVLEGTNAGIVAERGRRTNIVVKGAKDVRESPEVFSLTQFAAGDGGLVRAGDVAKLERVAGPVKIERENASRFAIVQAYVSGRDLVGFVDDAQRAVAQGVPLPAGYSLVWGGQFENQRRAATRLSIVVPIALALIFGVLFATLRSMRQAILILANVPFAMVGGVLSLWASGEYLSVPASVGFIALLGIAVLNGLVLVSHFNELLATGMPIRDVVFEGSIRRLRPVLMTASIAAFGLVPLLYATGPGSEIQRPLAIVVIGGLITSTALTLILLPILFRRFGVVATEDGGGSGILRWTNPYASSRSSAQSQALSGSSN